MPGNEAEECDAYFAPFCVSVLKEDWVIFVMWKHIWHWKNLYVICRVFNHTELEKHGHSSCKRNDKELAV